MDEKPLGIPKMWKAKGMKKETTAQPTTAGSGSCTKSFPTLEVVDAGNVKDSGALTSQTLLLR